MELTQIDLIQGFSIEIGDTVDLGSGPVTVKSLNDNDTTDVIVATVVDEYEDEDFIEFNAFADYPLLAYVNDEDEDI